MRLGRRQRMMLKLLKLVTGRHVPKLFASMMIKDGAGLLLCANMVHCLLCGRHRHWTNADVTTLQLLLLHDGMVLLRRNLLHLRGGDASFAHGLLDRLIELIKLRHF